MCSLVRAGMVPFQGKEPGNLTVEAAESTTTALEPASPEIPSWVAVKEAKEFLLARGILATHNFKQERQMVQEMVKHMAPRIGTSVYQIVSVSTPIICKTGLLKTFSATPPTTVESNGNCMWSLETYSAIRGGIAPLLNKFNDLRLWGLTKPLKKPSEMYSRVVATMMPPFEMYLTTGEAMDMMSANFSYALIDEDGEVHPPKDPDRREIQLTDSDMSQLRQSAYADLHLMAENDCNLSPRFLRLIGLEEKATAVEAAAEAAREEMLSSKKRKQVTECTARATEAREKKAAKAAREREERAAARIEYPIEEILEERPATGRAITWYKVRWSGYESAWEAWRIEGAVGDPLVTWEPLVNLRHTEALERWEQQQLMQP